MNAPAWDPSALKQAFAGPPPIRLAVAESMTAGGLQQRIGRISGASAFFLGGITAYNLMQKVSHLGVDEAEANACDCVSPRIAEQMARGVCILFGADVGAATTGYAEPAPAAGVNEPFAYWAIARQGKQWPEVIASGKVECAGLSRAQAQDRVSEAVLAALPAAATARSG